MQHSMECFRELVCMLLGEGAVAEAKCECGRSLGVLGMEVRVYSQGFSFRPVAGKVRRWCEALDRAIGAKRLYPHEADKLSGRLSWACSKMFHRFGRAMLLAANLRSEDAPRWCCVTRSTTGFELVAANTLS